MHTPIRKRHKNYYYSDQCQCGTVVISSVTNSNRKGTIAINIKTIVTARVQLSSLLTIYLINIFAAHLRPDYRYVKSSLLVSICQAASFVCPKATQGESWCNYKRMLFSCPAVPKLVMLLCHRQS
jgi:hypothetical protein